MTPDQRALDRITTALIIGACITLLIAAIGQVMPVLPAILATAAVGTACAADRHATPPDTDHREDTQS